jgi:hypothetical protein
MMETGTREPFGAIDPKLTMFALANGMDLAKGEGYRRLEWFMDGLERGILLRIGPDGGFAVSTLVWKTGKAVDALDVPVASGLATEAVTGALSDAVEVANGMSSPP